MPIISKPIYIYRGDLEITSELICGKPHVKIVGMNEDEYIFVPEQEFRDMIAAANTYFEHRDTKDTDKEQAR